MRTARCPGCERQRVVVVRNVVPGRRVVADHLRRHGCPSDGLRVSEPVDLDRDAPPNGEPPNNPTSGTH